MNCIIRVKFKKVWQHVRKSNRVTVASSLIAESFAQHYGTIMTDDGMLNEKQKQIESEVIPGFSCIQSIELVLILYPWEIYWF